MVSINNQCIPMGNSQQQHNEYIVYIIAVYGINLLGDTKGNVLYLLVNLQYVLFQK